MAATSGEEKNRASVKSTGTHKTRKPGHYKARRKNQGSGRGINMPTKLGAEKEMRLTMVRQGENTLLVVPGDPFA